MADSINDRKRRAPKGAQPKYEVTYEAIVRGGAFSDGADWSVRTRHRLSRLER
jgi:hypothetical protein